MIKMEFFKVLFDRNSYSFDDFTLQYLYVIPTNNWQLSYTQIFFFFFYYI